jgi:hypothetical protein
MRRRVRIIVYALDGVKKAQETDPGATSRFILAVTVSFRYLESQILLTSRRAVLRLATMVRVPKLFVPFLDFLRDSLSG